MTSVRSKINSIHTSSEASWRVRCRPYNIWRPPDNCDCWQTGISAWTRRHTCPWHDSSHILPVVRARLIFPGKLDVVSSSAITSITYDEDSANYRCLRHCVGKAPARSELHQDWLRIDHMAIILVKAQALLIYVGVQLAKRNRHAGIGIWVFIPTFHQVIVFVYMCRHSF